LYDALGNLQAARVEYGPLLRDLFERELRYRLGDDESDDDTYFENIYFCGLLLYELAAGGVTCSRRRRRSRSRSEPKSLRVHHWPSRTPLVEGLAHEGDAKGAHLLPTR
jgi:hypothetical protein